MGAGRACRPRRQGAARRGGDDDRAAAAAGAAGGYAPGVARGQPLHLQPAVADGAGAHAAAGEQAILFLNRRGSRTFILCRACGHVPKCRYCDVPLVWHADVDLVLCHRCDYHERRADHLPAVRLAAASGASAPAPSGSRKRCASCFPAARVLRWDRDTAARKGAHEAMLATFLAHEADVLVGTQMIAKGLDIPLVTLVGVISADTGLHLPDFRAAERTFQLLTQVAGRAGRRTAGRQRHRADLQPRPLRDPGRRPPRLPRLLHAGDPLPRRGGLPAVQPPRQAGLQRALRTRGQAEARRMAAQLHELVRRHAPDAVEVIGPAPCFTHKLRGRYRWQVLLRGQTLTPVLRA